MKKVLSIVLALMMIVSVNAFALSTSDLTDGSSAEVLMGIGSGMETVLTKSGNTLTAKVELVGPLKKVTGMTAGFWFDTTKITYASHAIENEFQTIAPTWEKSEKVNYTSTGYINVMYTTTNANVSIDIAAGDRISYATFTFTILDGEDVTSANYADIIKYSDAVKAKSKLECNLASLSITPKVDTTEIFSFDASGLDSYNLSINTPANGVATLSETTVAGGQSADLTVIPAVGYYISSVMAGETNITSSFDAYRGGTIEYTPTANTAITVAFAELENVTEDVTTSTGMTGVDALTLPEVFRGKVDNEAIEDVSIAFGQIAPNGGKEVAGYGIYLTNSDGSDVTTAAPSIGPKFAAKSISADNQFGIIFEQIKPGSYFAQTYIEYTDGSIVLGIKVPFTVAE